MKTKVLYVDDELSNLRIFKDSFRRDFEIYLAESGIEALKLLEDTMVDVVVTDQKMPGMTGVELLREITLRFDKIPKNRLILSGFAKDEEIQEAFEHYRLSKFVSKPWEYDNLKNVILQAVEE